jgi:hypothetical protein
MLWQVPSSWVWAPTENSSEMIGILTYMVGSVRVHGCAAGSFLHFLLQDDCSCSNVPVDFFVQCLPTLCIRTHAADTAQLVFIALLCLSGIQHMLAVV